MLEQLLREGRVPNQNQIALGTVWNDWQTNWTGALTSVVTATGGRFMRGRAIMQRTTITSINQVNQSRTGITTTAVPQTIRTSMGIELLILLLFHLSEQEMLTLLQQD